MEAIRFRGALLRIIKKVLSADPRLGPFYLRNIDLADSYMRLWVRMEDVPPVAFLIPKKTPSNTQLVGFHLFHPMGYIGSAPYFFMATETVADLANKSISQREQADEHSFELIAESRAADNAGTLEAQADSIWGHIPEEQRSAEKSNVDVYLDDFISVIQGGLRERRQMLRHLFHQIEWGKPPNEEANTNCKDPISLKKLVQGDGKWSTWKTVLVWDLDTIYHLLHLPP